MAVAAEYVMARLVPAATMLLEALKAGLVLKEKGRV